MLLNDLNVKEADQDMLQQAHSHIVAQLQDKVFEKRRLDREISLYKKEIRIIENEMERRKQDVEEEKEGY